MEYFEFGSLSMKVFYFYLLLCRLLYHFMFPLSLHRLEFKSCALTKTTYVLVCGVHSYMMVHKLHHKRLLISCR